jgi:hypothetical protein
VLSGRVAGRSTRTRRSRGTRAHIGASVVQSSSETSTLRPVLADAEARPDVRGRGRVLFRAVERLDLEGIVAKRVADPYMPDTVWRNIRNGAYTQMEGRRDLFYPPSKRA